MPGEKRMIDKFEIIHSLQIGAREVVVGVSPEQEFMCCFCEQDGIHEYYTEAMASDDYLEIMELYTDRLKGQVAALQAQRKTLHIPLDVLGQEQCFPLLDSDDITGKVVAVKPSSLRYEYRRADCQLMRVNWMRSRVPMLTMRWRCPAPALSGLMFWPSMQSGLLLIRTVPRKSPLWTMIRRRCSKRYFGP